MDQNLLISDVIKQYNIDFDVSFSTKQVSKAEVKEILENEASSTVSDITDGFGILREKIPFHWPCMAGGDGRRGPGKDPADEKAAL